MAKIYVRDSVQIKEGDKVDFLYFMGGGAR